MEEESRICNKLITIDFSKNPETADIGIIGGIENGKKVVRLYKVDRNVYTPKMKIKEVSHDINDLEELQNNSTLIAKLVFYNNESIESLIYILSEMYKLKLKEDQ